VLIARAPVWLRPDMAICVLDLWHVDELGPGVTATMIGSRDKYQWLGFFLRAVAVFSENRVAAYGRSFERNHGVARFDPVICRRNFGRSGFHGRSL